MIAQKLYTYALHQVPKVSTIEGFHCNTPGSCVLGVGMRCSAVCVVYLSLTAAQTGCDLQRPQNHPRVFRQDGAGDQGSSGHGAGV